MISELFTESFTEVFTDVFAVACVNAGQADSAMLSCPLHLFQRCTEPQGFP